MQSQLLAFACAFGKGITSVPPMHTLDGAMHLTTAAESLPEVTG